VKVKKTKIFDILNIMEEAKNPEGGAEKTLGDLKFFGGVSAPCLSIFTSQMLP